ncbi:MAG: 30S ribosomal protein S16 [Ignavibacteria bacterium]|nr:30S ribosomal protein S16 [Ignavibacteria bacterium]
MVKIRLRRKGKKHYPFYDIVVVDSRVKRDGNYIERLGYYDPNTSPSTIVIDSDRALHWLDVGAQPTDVVRNLLSYQGILLYRHLLRLGKSKEEIDELVQKHKEIVLARYFRRKELRKKREEAKKKQSEKEKES